MQKIRDLRAKAAQCRALAEASREADVQHTYRELARHWDDLADTLAKTGLYQMESDATAEHANG